jgi:acetyl-CoA acetyltransferase
MEFKATQRAAKMAYDMAALKPGDIDVAELHDAFTIFEIIDSEDMGFFEKGQAGEAIKQGITSLEGDLPINTSGGHKARGHPVGASGLAQIVEIFWQLTREAQKRQVDGAKVGLAQSIGGLANNNFVTILEACS